MSDTVGDAIARAVHQNPDLVTPPSTDLPDWQADQEREIDEHRSMLDHHLTDAAVALRRAAGEVNALIDLYDVEIAEGDGCVAEDTIRQMLVTLAGVRATTVDAGR